MSEKEIYKETTITIESPLLDEEVQEQIRKAAKETLEESAAQAA